MSYLAITFAAAALAAGGDADHHQGMAEHDPAAHSDIIADAERAGPVSLTDHATIVDLQGNVLREGHNGYVCMPESPAMGPMCNDSTWMELLGAFMAGKPYKGGKFGLSYMLAGEGDAPGVSNIDPTATEPTADNQWIKEGPHLMIILPDAAMYEGMSTDPADPVYVMWKGTPYAHLMVRIVEEEGED